MPKSIKRSLGIFDVMILMVGVAVAALFTRLYLVNNYDQFFSRLENVPTTKDYVRWIMGESAEFACLSLTAVTPVAFFIRLRRPRPDLSRLLLQPGAMALFSVMLIVIVGAILTGVAVAIEGSGPWFYYYQVYLIPMFPCAGAAVAVVWTLQALGKRWKPEGGAIDRLGQFLGICWIVTFLVGTSAMLQQGAWSATKDPQNLERNEAFESSMKAQENEMLTRERDILKIRLEGVEEQRSKLKEIINEGDRERWKSELVKQLESLDTDRQMIHEEMDQIGKRPFEQYLDELPRPSRAPRLPPIPPPD